MWKNFFTKPKQEQQAIEKHSLHLLITIILVTILGTIGIGYFVEKNLQIRAFDDWGYEALVNMPHPTWLNDLVAPVNYNFLPWGNGFTPSFLMVIIAAFMIYMIWK